MLVGNQAPSAQVVLHRKRDWHFAFCTIRLTCTGNPNQGALAFRTQWFCGWCSMKLNLQHYIMTWCLTDPKASQNELHSNKWVKLVTYLRSLNMSESHVPWQSSRLFCADEVSLQNIARSCGRSRDRGAHGCLAWCRCCSTARNAAHAASHQGATATISSCRSCWNWAGRCQRSWKSTGKLGLSNQKV